MRSVNVPVTKWENHLLDKNRADMQQRKDMQAQIKRIQAEINWTKRRSKRIQAQINWNKGLLFVLGVVESIDNFLEYVCRFFLGLFIQSNEQEGEYIIGDGC